MSKRAEEKALEYANNFILTVDHEGNVKDAYQDGYEQAEKDFAELLLERIKTWESIYDENEQFGIDNEQANAVLEELKALLEEVGK